jgi:hypothetical protein
MRKYLLSAAVMASLGAMSACAPPPPTATATPVRSPALGDPGALPGAPAAAARPTAADLARGDKQPPGTTNGNQPDRAAAASGVR